MRHFLSTLDYSSTDAVLDSARSAVVRQATNRLWSAAAILASLLGE